MCAGLCAQTLHLALTSGTRTEGAPLALALPTESMGACVGAAPLAATLAVHVNELAATVLQQLLFHGGWRSCGWALL